MEFLSIMMQVWERYWSLFLEGLGMTVYMGLVTVLISTVSGSLMALMRRSRLGVGKFRPISWIATVYVEVIRGTPILLQLYFFYFMLPQWLPFLNLSEFTCVMVACCVNSTAYVCEIVRAGIQAVDIGQTEAARSLGLTGRQTMIHIVLPQAVKNILPALCNEFVAIVKETSLASTFFIGELMTQFKTIQGITFRVLEPLTIIGIIYFLLTFVLSKLIALLERRMSASER
ncbi:MAG TPA: amino acid ABC transporter permease [Candidatus Copromonas avistercoris]|nr:amino acid ABC transporter permease [Candidatus Copromonas avistercoris]